MIKNFIYSFILLLSVPMLVSGQYEPVTIDYTPPSPNASALAKYGDIPVSYYTGIPDIKIPIYTISTRYLNLPVYLSYHAGGVRVEETASSAGLGWSLHAGGIISRTVMGLNDEKDSKGFIRIGAIPEFNQQNYSVFEQYQRGQLDGQADLFNFNFGSYTGRFVINKSHEIVKAPWGKMKLEFQLGVENSVDQILNWTASAEDGTKYVFESREYTTVLETENLIGTNPPVVETPTPYVSSWYLTKIISANGLEEYTFQYEPYTMEYYQNIVETHYSFTLKQSSKMRSKVRVEGQRLTGITFPFGQVNFQYYDGDRCDLAGDKALERIIVSDGAFQEEFQLVHSYFDQGFVSPWSTCTGGDSDLGKRLRLDQVIEDPDSDNPKKHSFEYHEDSFLPDRFSSAQDHWGYYNGKDSNTTLIPVEYYSVYSDEDLIQSYLPGGNRSPDTLHVKAGSLKKITYPTGGSSEFDLGINDCQTDELPHNIQNMSATLAGTEPDQTNIYISKIARPFVVLRVSAFVSEFADPLCYLLLKVSGNGYNQTLEHYYSSSSPEFESFIVNVPATGTYTISAELSSPFACTIQDPFGFQIEWENEVFTVNKTASGLRVNKIIDNPLIGPPKKQFFKYALPDGNTSGSVVTTPNYGYYYQEYNTTQSIPVKLYYVRTQFTNNPLVLTQGGIVGYSRVLVADDSLLSNGYTELKYTSPSDHPDNYNNELYPELSCLEFPFAPAESMEWKRGLLTSKAIFKKDGSTFKPVNIEWNTYSFHDYAHLESEVKSVKTGIYVWDTYANLPLEFRVQFYEFKPHKQLLQRTINETFHETNSLKDTVNYYYTSDNFLDYTEAIKSDKRFLNKYFYPSNYPANATLDSMVTANILTPVVAKENWIETLNGSFLLFASATEFSQKSPGVFLPEAHWSFKGKVPQSAVGTVSQSDVVRDRQLLERDAIIVKRDLSGNIIEVLNRDSLRIVFLWDQAGRYAVAKVIHAEGDEVYYTSFESFSGNTMATSKAGMWSKQLTGSALNLTASVSPKTGGDYLLTYWWRPDLQTGWQLQVEPYNNIQPQQSIQTAKTSGYVDELRFYPRHAEMSTFTYASGVGVTSITDPNHITAMFEYDGNGRLKAVRDESGNILGHYQYRYMDADLPISFE